MATSKAKQTAHSRLGAEVSRLRRQKGWSLKELATRARVTTTTLRACERGTRHTQPDKLARIAKQLGTTAERLKHVEPTDPRTKDLQDEDYEIAQWFHHASRVLKNTIWDLREGKDIGAALADPELRFLLQHWATFSDKQKYSVLNQFRFAIANPDVERPRTESDTGGAPDGFPAIHTKVRSPKR